jgi:hypothetical protein
MPRLLRAFATIFIAFPGALIWLQGAVLCVKVSGTVLYRQEAGGNLPDLAIFAMGAAAVAIGYLMVIGTRILCGDSRELFAGFHFGQRVMWNLAIQLTGCLTAGAAFTTIVCIATADWETLTLPLVLLVFLAFAAIRLVLHWQRLSNTWIQEIIDARTARSRLDLPVPQPDKR